MSDSRHFLQEALGDGLGASAILQALQSSAEGVSRVAEQGREHARQLKEISETLHVIDKRLAVVESGSVQAKVDDHEKRIVVLEAEENRRKGALGMGGWMVKNWPAMIGYIALALLAVEKGIVRV